jgi:exosortase A
MTIVSNKFDVARWAPTFGYLFLSLAAVIFFYRSTVVGLGTLWTDSSDFSHGWLIIPIFLWLLWNNRANWLDVQPKPSPLGLAVGLMFGLIWLLGDVARVSVVRQLGIIGFIPAIALSVLGLEFVKRNLFAFFFVFFGVPAGEALNPVLMKYTASATIWALQKTGVPVYREGLHFILPTGSWSVVDACSGLRYLICSLILGLLFAQFNYRTVKKKAIFLLICLVLAIVANWVRAYSVVMVGHLSHMKYGTGDDHVWYGWIFFGVMMMCIFWIGVRYGDAGMNQASVAIPSKAQEPGSQLVTTKSSIFLSSVVVVLGLLATTVWAFVPQNLRDFEVYKDFADRVLQTSGSKPSTFPFAVGFPDAYSSKAGLGTNGSSLQVSYFGKQDVNAEILALGNRLIREDQKLVRILDESRFSAPDLLALGKVREYSIVVGNEPWIVWHWFVVDGIGVPDAYYAKGFRAVSMLRRHGDHSVLLAVALPNNNNQSKDTLRAALKADALALHRATLSIFKESAASR